MFVKKRLASVTSFMVANLAMGAVPALSQSASEAGDGARSIEVNVVEEVLVTARRREETLFDSPTPITAISQEVIDTLRMNDARDMLTLVPTAFLQENNAGTARDINIRGVGTPTLFAESGVATYIDDIYSSGYVSYPTQFYDVERIEVLRGPQGALYGRNAVGGAVNVISSRTDQELGGYFRATAASFERREFEGMLNVPLGDTTAVRLVGWDTDQDEGAFYNPLADRYLDANSSQGGRIVFDSRLGERLSINLIYEQTDAEAAGTALFFPGDGETPGTIARDDHPVNAFETSRLAGSLNYDLDAGTLTFVFGTRSYELDGLEDTDLTGDNPFNPALGQLGKQVLVRNNEVDSDYLELRWLSSGDGPFTLLFGASYLDESASGNSLSDLPTLSDAFSGGALPATLDLLNDQSTESWAAFAEVTYDFTDALSVIASLRYTEDEKTVDFGFNPSQLLAGLVGAPQAASETQTFDQLTPGLTVAWSPSDDTRLYAKYQEGFRAGGFNFNVGSVGNLPYDEEVSTNYEIGARTALLGGAAVIGANVFFLDQDDVLVPLFDLTVPGPLGGYLANVGSAETYGVELEGTWQLTESLRIGGTVGWLDASFTDGQDSFGTDLDGNEIPSSRSLTYNLTASYSREIANDVRFFSDLVYSYRDEGFGDVQNSTEFSEAELLNAAAGFEYRGFQILAFVRNALDDDYDIAFGGFRPGSGATGVTRNEGRTSGVTLKYAF